MSRRRLFALAALLVVGAIVVWLAFPTGGSAPVRDAAGVEGGEGGLRGRVPASAGADGVVLQGRVVDVEHTGIEGASVHVEPAGAATPDASARVLSGHDGAFRISVSAAVREKGIVTAAAEGYAPGRWDLSEGTDRIEIVLKASVELHVHLVDRAGRAVSGARVVAKDSSRWHAEALELGATDADGNLVSRLLARPGEYSVSAKHRLGANFAPVRVSKDEPKVEVTLRMPESPLVRGRVVDAGGGGPVPGARVVQGMPAQRETTTDKEGRFDIPLPLTWDTQASYAGLRVYATGYAPARVDLRSVGEVEIRLHRGPRHHGRVVDSGGMPVAGASVSLSLTPGGSTGGQILVASRTSDEQGAFEFSEARVGIGITIVVAAKGFGSTVTDLAATAEGGDLGDFVVRPGLTMAGRLLTHEGAAVADCPLQVVATASALKPAATSPGIWYQEGSVEVDVSTNEAGAFRVVDLAPGVYRVTAWPRGTAPFGKTVELRESQEVELRLPPSRVVTVTVVGPDDAPVAGCRVGIQGREGSGGDTTDSRGRAVLHVPAGEVEIFVGGGMSGGFDLARVYGRKVGAQETDVRISLVRSWEVSGTVRGLVGDDVFGAEVEVVSADGKWSVRLPTHVTGRFSCPVPGPEAEPFTCRLTGFRTESLGGLFQSRLGYEGSTSDVRAGEDGVVIEATRPASIDEAHMRVVSPAGVGVEGAFVAYLDPDARMMMSVPTDENGRAVFRGLQRGRSVSVIARPDRADRRRRGWLESMPTDVAAGPGETTIPLRAARRIAGKVTGPDGRPIQGATVELSRGASDGPMRIQQETSDRDGAFELVFDAAMLWGDPATLRAQTTTGQSRTITVPDGTKDGLVLVVDQSLDAPAAGTKDK